jgi:hypothetical protein
MVRSKPVKRSEADAFIVKLTLLKEEAFRIGMYMTGQKLEEPVRQAGWELAELIGQKDVE